MSDWKIGDKVFVSADNYGSPATIVAEREHTVDPPSRYQVRTDRGDVFWAFDFEIDRAEPMTESERQTREHIEKVQARIQEVVSRLTIRAAHHDESKLQEPELSGYEALHTRLADVEYGTDEYRAALAEARPTIEHHYKLNSHHPEHFPNGVAGMTLIDLVEMFCDWKAASERTKQGSILASIKHNRDRWGLNPQLASILENTVIELGW